MRNFAKTTIPTEGYQEVKQVGNRYVVHLEGVADGEITTCYECMTDSEPNIAELTRELQEWKAYRAKRDLELAKKIKIAELVKYDSSPAVNAFVFKGIEMWLDKATRTGLLLRLNAEKAAGKAMTTLWFGTMSFELPIDYVFQLLFAIEVYASACHDNTASHTASIESLGNKEDVEGYDFTTGYPDKLNFGAMLRSMAKGGVV